MKFAKLILKNVLRNKRRTLLTLSSLVVSLFLIVSLATILTELERGSQEGNPSRLMSRHSVSLAFLLPIADLQRIQTVKGVKAVMPFTWFGGIYKDEKNVFPQISVEPEEFLPIYKEFVLKPAEKEAWFRTRTGAVAGRKLAERFGWKVGDRIPIQATFLRPSAPPALPRTWRRGRAARRP